MLKGNTLQKYHKHFIIFDIGRLYWYSNENPPKNVHDSYFFNVDEVIILWLLKFIFKILVYKGYNKDFGPLNLA